MTKLNVIKESREHITRHCNTRDQWDRDDTRQEHSIKGIEIVENKKGNYFELETPLDIVPNKDYYLLVAYYDTGDSFGHDENQLDIVEIYDSFDLAKKNAEILKEDYTKNPDEFSVSITNGTNKEYKFHCPWKGYFEHLNEIEIVPVSLNKSYKIKV